MYRIKMLLFILFCTSLFFVCNALFAAEKKVKVKTEPGETATWSGKGGIESGRENFQAHCIPCHGDKAKGDGPLADSLGEGVRPRDLTNKDILSNRTDEFLFGVIKKGGVSAVFSEAMVSFDATLTDEEIKNVIAYIRSGICKCKYKEESK